MWVSRLRCLHVNAYAISRNNQSHKILIGDFIDEIVLVAVFNGLGDDNGG